MSLSTEHFYIPTACTGSYVPAFETIPISISTTQGIIVMRGKYTKRSGAPVVLYHHGFGATGVALMSDNPATGLNDSFLQWEKCRQMAEAGYIVIAGDFGLTLWGNGGNHTMMQEAVDWAGTNLGAYTTQFVLMGASMGGAASLSFASHYPSKVACCYLFIPVTNITSLYNEAPPTFQYSIDAAYPDFSAGSGPIFQDYNPTDKATTGAFTGMPIRIWYASDDPIATPADLTNWYNICGSHGGNSNISLNSAGALGHGDPVAGVPTTQDLLEFTTKYLHP